MPFAFFSSEQDRNWLVVNVFAKNDEKQELLEDTDDIVGELDFYWPSRGCINLINPASLGLRDLFFQNINHMNKAILVKGMGGSFSFLLPQLIWFWEKERITIKILKDSFEQASLVNLGIFCNEHLLHNSWICYHESQWASRVEEHVGSLASVIVQAFWV